VTTSGPDLPQPTFARELDELAASGLSLWLAAALPTGPTVLWACDRHLAVTLAQDRQRELLLLEPREAAAAAGIRHGSPGLQVRHAPLAGPAPDLSDLGMGDFAAAVLDLTAPADEVGGASATVPAVAALVAAEAVVIVVTTADGTAPAVDALETLGWTTVVVDAAVAACAHIGLGDAPHHLRVVGDPSERAPQMRLVVAGRDAGALPSLVVVGSEQGGAAWRSGVDQVSATVTALDAVVDRERAALIAALQAEVARGQVQLAAARQDAAELAAAVDAMHASTSWRLTRPLRMLRDRVGRA
jgi:hypothetical protein